MSVREEKILSLTNVDLSKKSTEDLAPLFNEVLLDGIHGFCSSPYEEGQQPGDTLTEEQIRRRLKIIQPYTKWIRSFSCTEGNELIPKIARELGIKTFVGAWLGNDAEINKKEIAGLIKLANEGYVDIAAVGNEVEFENFSVFFQPSIRVFFPSDSVENLQCCLRIVRQRFHLWIVPISDLRIGPRHPLPFPVEDVLDNGVNIYRHAESHPHIAVGEKGIAQVISYV